MMSNSRDASAGVESLHPNNSTCCRIRTPCSSWIGPGGHLLHYPIGNGDHNFLLVKRHYGPWPDRAWVAPSEPGAHVAAFEAGTRPSSR